MLVGYIIPIFLLNIGLVSPLCVSSNWTELLANLPFVNEQPLVVLLNQNTDCDNSLLKAVLHQRQSENRTLKFANWKSLSSSRLPMGSIQEDLVFTAMSKPEAQFVINSIAIRKLGQNSVVFLVVSQKEDLSRTLEFKDILVDQNLIVVNLYNMTAYEAYTINDKSILNRVGQWDFDNEKAPIFLFNPRWYSTIRSNLNGIHLKIVTDRSPPHVNLDPDYQTKAQFFDSNQTYDVSSLTPGLFHDIMLELAHDLNFTFSVYKNVEEVWGSEVDGKPTGMLNNLSTGSVDLLMADYTMTTTRQKYASYLPVLQADYFTIVIKKDFKDERLDIATYTGPYHLSLWLAILALSAINAILLSRFNKTRVHNQNGQKAAGIVVKVDHYLNWLWTSVIAFFGLAPMFTRLRNRQLSNQLTLFCCALGGVIVWMAYQAALTSRLATIRVQFPFDSLETLLESDFK